MLLHTDQSLSLFAPCDVSAVAVSPPRRATITSLTSRHISFHSTCAIRASSPPSIPLPVSTLHAQSRQVTQFSVLVIAIATVGNTYYMKCYY